MTLKNHNKFHGLSVNLVHAPMASMKLEDVQLTAAQARASLGSANPTVLNDSLRKLLDVFQWLLDDRTGKDQELARLRTEAFGAKSEKLDKAPLLLTQAANTPVELNDEAPPTESTPDQKAALAQARELKRKARALEKIARPTVSKKMKIDENKIPLETVIHPVPQDIKGVCPICLETPKDKGLSYTAEEIDILASAIAHREHQLHKASCGCGALQFVMPPPDRGIEQTIFSPMFVARIIYDKFFLHLPTYRQAKHLAVMGLTISRDRLIGLILKASTCLKPLTDLIHEYAQKEFYQYCDESNIVVVINGERQKRTIWCLVTDLAVSFRITEHRNKAEARAFVGPNPGVLVTDRLSIYRSLISGKDEGGCIAHCRRYFWYSLASSLVASFKVLELIGELYKIERAAKDRGLQASERLKLRQEKSSVILSELKNFLIGTNPPPRSSFGKAKAYTLEHWDTLTYFMKDGRVEIDNNKSEGNLRDPKLGWKNFLFAQSELGCEAVAAFYTIFACCRLHKINPIFYLADVLGQVSRSANKPDWETLLPWNWKPSQQVSTTAPPPKRVERLNGEKIGKIIRIDRRIDRIRKKVAFK